MRPLTSGGHRKWLNGVERKRDHIAPGISSYNGSQLLAYADIRARTYNLRRHFQLNQSNQYGCYKRAAFAE